MAPPTSSSAVTVGGKGATLSPESVYAIATASASINIDAAAKSKQPSSSPRTAPSAAAVADVDEMRHPRFLPSDESRAALVVLLCKLVAADSSAAAAAVEEALSLDSGFETIDFASALAFFASIAQLTGRSDVAALSDGFPVFNAAAAPCVGIGAMLDCCASALVRVVDTVAALSFEAARADAAAALELPASGDGFAVKGETDVASDMKMLLFGSKLAVGPNDSAAFNDVPDVHGSFREAVRVLHSRIRVELNSPVRVKKASGCGGDGKESALVALVLQFAMVIQKLSDISYCRAKSSIQSIVDVGIRSAVSQDFEKGCSFVGSLTQSFNSIMMDAASLDYLSVMHGVYHQLCKLRDLLGWEAALALFVIESDDSVEKAQADGSGKAQADGSGSSNPNGESTKRDKKSEKKKKSLGKGTSMVTQLLKEWGMNQNVSSIADVSALGVWAGKLSLYFDPREAHLDHLTTLVKEIVESNEVRRLPKIPKGTRDFDKKQMAIRERAFSIITSVFKMHGAVALDTPVFELRETLMGKYGEDSKLIYDLADQGGELCSLRYDLTVPFARYLAMNNISSMKRYQIAKVYRRDNPSKGRYREFYQCDFDVAGQYETMEPDFEVLKVLTELLDQLDIGDYEIKLNHRKLLDGMLEICGVPSEKFRTVCSSIDKLDKQTFEQIRKELVEEKGIAVCTADEIGSLVKTRGAPLQVLLELRKESSKFMKNSGSVLALNELEILFKALEKARCLHKIVFDLSLARGLDYYTGVIYEAVFKGTTQVGSIAAGGRYDNLVGMFSGRQVPAVGVSLGIERVFAIMEQQEKDKNQRATETQVLVSILGKDLDLAAEIVSELWNAKIKAEFKLSKRIQTHINYARQTGISWMVLVGESELKNGTVKLKNIEAGQEEELARATLLQELGRRINVA